MRTVFVSLTALCAAACSGDPAASNKSGSAPTKNLPAFFTCIDEAGQALIAAHRGGPRPGFPENALETLERTAQDGVWLMEIDIRTSADGTLFLHHDEDLDDSTTGSGMVRDMKWEDIRTVSLLDSRGQPTAFRPSRFDDVLNWADGKAILQLDIKRGTDYDDVALAVEAAGANARVIPIAYSMNQAFVLARKFPASMISVPIESAQDFNDLRQSGIAAERLLAWGGIENVDEDMFQYLDDQNVEVAFGTLGGRNSIDAQIERSGDDSRYADLISQGVDVISTDRPQEALRALKAEDLNGSVDACAG